MSLVVTSVMIATRALVSLSVENRVSMPICLIIKVNNEFQSRNLWKSMAKNWTKALTCSQWCAFRMSWLRKMAGKRINSLWIVAKETLMECTLKTRNRSTCWLKVSTQLVLVVVYKHRNLDINHPCITPICPSMTRLYTNETVDLAASKGPSKSLRFSPSKTGWPYMNMISTIMN